MGRLTWLPALAIAAASALGLAGCSSSDPGSAGTAEQSETENLVDGPEVNRNPDFEVPTVSGQWGQVPEIKTIDGDPPKELVAKLITPGDGAEVAAGGLVTIYYTGFLWDGKTFDSSFNHGDEAMTLSLNSVIDGWKYGLPGSKVGDRILLIVPPEYGYGSVEQGNIPPDSTLIFVVDIVDVPGADLTPLKEATATDEQLPEGLKITGGLGEAPVIAYQEGAVAPTEQIEITLAKGGGDAVTSSNSVVYHYTGSYWGSQSASESTWQTGPTVQPAQDTVFLGQNVGDRILFVFPPEDESSPALVMIVDIVAVY